VQTKVSLCATNCNIQKRIPVLIVMRQVAD